jgi:hypothetical protein
MSVLMMTNQQKHSGSIPKALPHPLLKLSQKYSYSNPKPQQTFPNLVNQTKIKE